MANMKKKKYDTVFTVSMRRITRELRIQLDKKKSEKKGVITISKKNIVWRQMALKETRDNNN